MLETNSFDHLFGELVEQQEDALGYVMLLPLLPPPRFTASLCTARDLKSIETACRRPLRGLVEKGPCFCWVFTVTNKTQLVQYDQRHWF